MASDVSNQLRTRLNVQHIYRPSQAKPDTINVMMRNSFGMFLSSDVSC